MAQAMANGMQIEYETFGASGRPIVLIIGFGVQMLLWSEEFCHQLVDLGHYVIRFDNRDTGLSTKCEEAGIPDVKKMQEAFLRGEEAAAPYSYYDMGDDTVGLLDFLGIEKAHICGMSMGAAIAQTMAIRHPDRVLSLTSIFGSTGHPTLPPPKPEIAQLLMTPSPVERDAAIANTVQIFRTITGSGFPFDEEWTRRVITQSYDRCFYPPGRARQAVARFVRGNRRPALESVTAPTLVIHGDVDPLVPVEHGKDTAEAIPGAKLMIIEGMGHDLPHGGAWPRIAEAIAAHTQEAEDA
jgi:pimeloyl-ACP methyl ester carboxylesterase